MVVTIANPGDPTADPSKAWPEDRRTVEVGTLMVQQIQPEGDGPCCDINFDPTVLPSGIRTSDDRSRPCYRVLCGLICCMSRRRSCMRSSEVTAYSR
jgi:hypothetical protein